MSAWRQWWQLEPEPGGDGAAAAAALPPPPQDMRGLLGKVGSLLAGDRALLAAAVFFMVAAAAAELAIPHYITAAVFSAARERSERLFAANLSLLLASTAAYAGCAAIRGWLFSMLNTNLLQRLR